VPTLSERVSDVLGQAVIASLIALVGTVIYLWVSTAELHRDFDGVVRDVADIRLNQREFRKPGARYSASNGDRDRALAKADSTRNQAAINELRHDLHAFRAGGSRFLPLGIQIQSQIDDCKEDMEDSRKQWIQCIRLHENMGPRIKALEQNTGGD
jgi:hypothetical protein